MRKVHFVLSALTLAAVVLQFYLAGVGVFSMPEDELFDLHTTNGRIVLPVLILLNIPAAALARGRTLRFALGLVGLLALQTVIFVIAIVTTGSNPFEDVVITPVGHRHPQPPRRERAGDPRGGPCCRPAGRTRWHSRAGSRPPIPRRRAGPRPARHDAPSRCSALTWCSAWSRSAGATAALRVGRSPGRWALAGSAVVLARLVAGLVLAGPGCGAAADRLAGVALGLLTAALALVLLALSHRGARATLWGAAGAGAVSLVLTSVVGYPVWPGAAHSADHAHHHGRDGISVTDLREPAAAAGVSARRVELVARQQQVTLPSGRVVDAWTFGSLPGPETGRVGRAGRGDVAQCGHRRRRDPALARLPAWPNGEDGVAGRHPGRRARPASVHLPFRRRPVREPTGTTPIRSPRRRAARGLFGPLVVEPRCPAQAVTTWWCRCTRSTAFRCWPTPTGC